MAREGTVAILVGDGYEELEFWYPVLRFREAGYDVAVLSLTDDGEAVIGRRGYPVVPNGTVGAFEERPSIVVLPGFATERLDEYADRAGPSLRRWADSGARLAASGTGVEVLVACGLEAADESGAPATAEGAEQVPALVESLLGAEATLRGTTVAVLCENQYQELELWYPLLRLRAAGAAAYTVGPKAGAMYTSKLGYPVVSDLAAGDVDAADFDAVVIPGGHSPEGMRRSADLLDFVRKLDEGGRIVAAICHAGWVLASANIARGRRLTCVPIIRDDVINAGGDYVDEQVVRDGNLITSRLPSDLPIFSATIVEALAQRGPSDGRSAAALPEPTSNPAYATAARLVPLAVGVASANYTQISAPVEL